MIEKPWERAALRKFSLDTDCPPHLKTCLHVSLQVSGAEPENRLGTGLWMRERRFSLYDHILTIIHPGFFFIFCFL